MLPREKIIESWQGYWLAPEGFNFISQTSSARLQRFVGDGSALQPADQYPVCVFVRVERRSFGSQSNPHPDAYKSAPKFSRVYDIEARWTSSEGQQFVLRGLLNESMIQADGATVHRRVPLRVPGGASPSADEAIGAWSPPRRTSAEGEAVDVALHIATNLPLQVCQVKSLDMIEAATVGEEFVCPATLRLILPTEHNPARRILVTADWRRLHHGVETVQSIIPWTGIPRLVAVRVRNAADFLRTALHHEREDRRFVPTPSFRFGDIVDQLLAGSAGMISSPASELPYTWHEVFRDKRSEAATADEKAASSMCVATTLCSCLHSRQQQSSVATFAPVPVEIACTCGVVISDVAKCDSSAFLQSVTVVSLEEFSNNILSEKYAVFWRDHRLPIVVGISRDVFVRLAVQNSSQLFVLPVDDGILVQLENSGCRYSLIDVDIAARVSSALPMPSPYECDSSLKQVALETNSRSSCVRFSGRYSSLNMAALHLFGFQPSEDR